MPKYVELRRHTDADGDVLTPEVVQAALEIGTRLGAAMKSSSQPAPSGPLRRSRASLPALERRCRGEAWLSRDCAPAARTAGELPTRRPEAARSRRSARPTPELVAADSAALAAALRRVFDALPEGGRALVVGHSPTNEAAVLGLVGEIVDPISKGDGVLVVEHGEAIRLERLG